jgi:hypothetical protein
MASKTPDGKPMKDEPNQKEIDEAFAKQLREEKAEREAQGKGKK